MKFFYVYRSFEEKGREYIGIRSCNCLPENDTKYFGSFEDKSFKPTGKTILFVCETRIEALEIEVELHDFFEVDVNPKFANKSRQRSSKFFYDPTGTTNPGSAVKRTELNKSNNPMKDSLTVEKFRVTRNNSSEWNENIALSRQTSESREKSRQVALKMWDLDTRTIFSEKRKGEGNPCFGKKWWVNTAGETCYSTDSPGVGWVNGRIFR